MQFIATFSLWFLLFVFLGRFQEIFPFLTSLQLGKVSVGLGFCVVLAQNAQNIGLLLGKSPIKNHLITLAILAIVGVPFSIYASSALDECIAFMELLLTTSIIVALSKDNVVNLQLGIICTLLFITIQMILQKTGGRISVSNTYDPNDIALLCIVFLPLAISFVSHKSIFVKLLALAASGSAVAGIALSGSRGGFIAMASVTLYAVVLAKKSRFTLIMLIGIGAIIFMGMAGDALWERLQSLRDGTDYNFEAGGGRLEIWRNGLEVAIRRPIFGVGIGQFIVGLGMLTNSPWKAAHNTFLEIAVDLGVAALVAFLGILLFIYRLGVRGAQSNALSAQEKTAYSYLRLSLLGYCIGSLFLSQAYSTITYTFFCLAVAMYFELEKKEMQATNVATQKEQNSKAKKATVPSSVYPLSPKTVPTNSAIANPVAIKAVDKQEIQGTSAPLPSSPTKPMQLSAERQKQLEEAEAARKRKKSRLEAGDMLIQNKTRI